MPDSGEISTSNSTGRQFGSRCEFKTYHTVPNKDGRLKPRVHGGGPVGAEIRDAEDQLAAAATDISARGWVLSDRAVGLQVAVRDQKPVPVAHSLLG
ncbi:hypothetical protein O1611_g8141 [Lasiodiplodia mahajangana]|uniref:Uncharacterized protein n=1 Tax=Lasiodiplodia mahajangana TaxID=1108764 RepID=A0ACC2JE57_9PEZI|nr:hypothetical protein O1611_g8141 [Lasiodiplodia mahajangana]